MMIEIHPTGIMESVGGQPCRIWRGTTDKGVPVSAWIAMVSPQSTEPQVEAEFQRELSEVKAERQLAYFDHRLL